MSNMNGAVGILKEWGVPIGKKFEVTLPEGQCSVSSLRNINDYIGRWCYEQRMAGLYVDLPNPVNLAKNNPDWKLLRDANNRTWVKRYADYVRDVSGIKLGAKFLGRLGTVVTHSFTGIDTVEYVVDFTDVCNWSPGDFCEYDDSCWWSDYNALRLSFFDGGGGCAIRFYDKDEGYGIGRAMIHGDEGSLFFFNFYEKDENSNLDRLRGILEKTFESLGIGGIDIRGCEFESNIYINNDAIVCRSEKSNGYGFQEYYNMCIKKTYERCAICRASYNISHMVETEHQFICKNCNQRDDLIVCECGVRGLEQYMNWVEFYGKYFCSGCFYGKLSNCDLCRDYFREEDFSLIGFHGGEGKFLGAVNLCENCLSRVMGGDIGYDMRVFISGVTLRGTESLPDIIDLVLLDKASMRYEGRRFQQRWEGDLIATLVL